MFKQLKSTLTMLLLVLVAAIIALFYYNVKKQQSFWARKDIKFIKPKFFIGSLQMFRRSKSFAEELQDLYKAFPKERYQGVYLFSQAILMIKDPELIKQITVKEFDHFVDHRPFVNPDVDPFWGKDLFSSTGERWRDLRSTLSPSFTGSKMRIMFNLMEECAEQFVDFFKNQPEEVVQVEIKDALTRYTNDVIATTAFGLKCNSLKNRHNEFYLMGKDASNFGGGLKRVRFTLHLLFPTLCRWLKITLTPSYIAQYFSTVIGETVKIREEKNILRPDMIHLMMEAKKKRDQLDVSSFTLQDIASQAFIFFIAGFETVSAHITFLLYELALNPDIQTRLREEILSVSSKINYEALLGLKYLDMVVSEALRKWPPAIALDRKVTKAFTIQPELPGEKPLHLEEGQICWFPTFGIHRDPKLYPDPEKFDPERFNDENKHRIHPATYLSFGLGPRNCIGSRFALLESKLIVFHLLANFEVVPVKRTQIPVVLDHVQFNLTAKGGIWLGLKKILHKI